MSKTEYKGVLKTWKDDRGFGFIKPEDGSDDLFIHISALTNSPRRPYRGDSIFYHIEHGDDGKSKAVNARIEGLNDFSNKKTANYKWIGITAIIFAVICIAYLTGYFLDFW